MNLWIVLLVLWVVASWGLLFGALHFSEGCLWDRRTRQLPLAVKLGAWLIVLISAPILMPVLIGITWSELFGQRRRLRALSRTHRDCLFERLHPANLPEAACGYFEANSPTILAMGFQQLGNFLLKREPMVIYGRCFLSDDGTVFATLLLLDQLTAFEFLSVLEDGRDLETISLTLPSYFEQLNRRSRAIVESQENVPLEEAYRRHRERLDEAEVTYQAQVLSFSPDQLQDVHTYCSRTVSAELHALGRRDEPPPAVLPAGRPRNAHTVTP